MKLTGSNSMGTGKLGDSVYAISGGVQIKRAYRKNISNPSTEGQVNQRARFKLASQVSAALSPVIAIPASGMSSARNQFVKRNFDSFYADGDSASVTYENLQLTAGNQGLPAISVSRTVAGGIVLELAESAANAVNRVCYCVYKKTTEDQMQLIGSVVQSTAGADGKFRATVDYSDGDIIIYAYGMRDNGEKATARYGNYKIANGEDLATLIMSRKIKQSDYSLTQTRGTSLFTDEDENVLPGPGEVIIYVTAGSGGSVSAQGLANGRMIVEYGTQVTLTATPDTNWHFSGWVNNGEQSFISSSPTLTFTATGMRDLWARFEYGAGLE